MIYVEMHGRLGNQLFQYATARSLQMKTGQEIVLRFGKVNGANTEGTNGWENSLKYFQISKYQEDNNTKSILFCMPILKKIVTLIYALGYRRFKTNLKKTYDYQIKHIGLLDRLGIWWLSNGFFDFSKEHHRDYYLNGSFESKQYFDEIRDQLLTEIIPKNEPLESNIELLKRIKRSNSICVSLRHFQIGEDRMKVYEVCTEAYYKTALEIMAHKIEKPLFVVFSDDIAWAQRVLQIKGDVVFENPGNPIWEKVRLMSSCKHFIIPNSSFAWWMQYLGDYDGKVVVGPTKWFNCDFDSPLVDENWIKIDREGKCVDIYDRSRNCNI